MKQSQAWLDLGNRPSRVIQTPSIQKVVEKTNTAVATIIGMLEVAFEQSELSGKTPITNFYSKAPKIMNHLMRTGEIANLTQADELRYQVMKELGIPNNPADTLIKKLISNGPIYEDRLNISLQKIIESIGSDTIESSIRERWITLDKKFFDADIHTLVSYMAVIKAFFYQKYGVEITKKTLQ